MTKCNHWLLLWSFFILFRTPPALAQVTTGELEELFQTASLWQVGEEAHRKKIDEARKRLVELGEPALRFILNEKLDTINSLEIRAIEVVVLGNGEKAIPLLVEKLQSEKPRVLRNAVLLLGSLKAKQAGPQIAHLLQRKPLPPKWVLRIILRVLAQLEYREGVPEILSFLNDPDELVVISATWALGVLKDPTTIPPLMDMLDSEQYIRRDAAENALSALANVGMSYYLRKALTETEESTPLKHFIRLAGRLKCQECVPVLIPFLKHSDWSVRGYAVEALGRIGTRRGLSAIAYLQHRESHPFVLFHIQKAMSQSPQKQKAPAGLP